MSDDELIHAFENGTLHPFPHELHVRVARRLLREPDGYDRMVAGIRRMAPTCIAPTVTAPRRRHSRLSIRQEIIMKRHPSAPQPGAQWPG